MKKRLMNILIPVFVVSVYVIALYFLMKYQYSGNILLRLNDIEIENIGTKVLTDFINSLLIVILLLGVALVKKKPLTDFGITINHWIIVSVLCLLYGLMFLIKRDFSIQGFYIAFFYLVVVSLSEEFVFRGYLFSSINKEFNFWVSAVVSGILWGIPHAFVSLIASNGNLFIGIANQLGMGIIVGAGFAFVYKKSKSLFIPILIHAILDYSSVLFAR